MSPDVTCIEACSSVQNLLDKRSRFAPSTSSLLAFCPVPWLLALSQPDASVPRWRLIRMLHREPTAPLVPPVRDAPVENRVMADVQLSGSGKTLSTIKHELEQQMAFDKIKKGLEGHLKGNVNFEHIYHCIHELIYTFEPHESALDEFRPLLFPFICNKTGIEEPILRALADRIIKAVISKISACCFDCSKINPGTLAPLAHFINTLRQDHITRIYTTNYDDIPHQAVPELYTGFDPGDPSPKPFDLKTFWEKGDDASLFHLHGSVHMGFPHPIPSGGDIGELYWYDDRAEALQHSRPSSTERRRSDGSSVLLTSVITGLDKLSQIQQRPMSHFYAALARDLLLCDVIYVIGSGLGDLHLNTWLQEARTRTPMPPLLLIDFWQGGFLKHLNWTQAESRLERKTMEMIKTLKINIYPGDAGAWCPVEGWTMPQDRSAAVWGNGFEKFLNAPDVDLHKVLKLLQYTSGDQRRSDH